MVSGIFAASHSLIGFAFFRIRSQCLQMMWPPEMVSTKWSDCSLRNRLTRRPQRVSWSFLTTRW